MIAIAVLLFAVGYLLLWSFFNEESPKNQLIALFSGGKRK